MIPKDCITLGDHIRKARLEREQYQSDVANVFRITDNTLTNWELSKTKIPRIYMPIIEEYLGYLPKEYEMSDLSRNLIRYRFDHKISIQNTAKLIGIDHINLTKVELGKVNIPQSTMKRIKVFTKKFC